MPPALAYVKATTPFDGPLAEKLASILETVPAEHGVAWESVVSTTRSRTVTKARKATAIAMHATGISLAEVGLAMGGKDHTTVIYYLRGKRARAAARV